MSSQSLSASEGTSTARHRTSPLPYTAQNGEGSLLMGRGGVFWRICTEYALPTLSPFCALVCLMSGFLACVMCGFLFV